IEEIRVDSGNVQVTDATCQRTGYRTDTKPNGSSQQSDQAANGRAAGGSDRELIPGLHYGDLPVGILLDYGCSVNCDASIGIELVESARALVRTCLIVKNYD